MYATVVDVDGDDVVLEVAPGIECRYMKRAIMDVVSPAETMDEPDADEAPADEVSEDYAAEEPSDLAGQDGTVDGVPGPGAEEDADEAAYEQATGTKKD
jgi:preprotein translocase subunit YajC